MTHNQGFPVDATHSIMEWLAAQPNQNLTTEAFCFQQQLDALHSPTIPASQFQGCIELFYSRALRLCTDYRKSLRSLTLPLEASQLNLARSISESLKRTALGFERILTDTDARAGTPQKRQNETASARALRLLSEHFLTIAQAGLEIDPDVWRIAYRLYAIARIERGALDPAGSPAETTLFAYKRLLAMASLEPQSLSPGELDWAGDYLARISGQVLVQEQAPQQLDGAWYWLDPNGGAEPQACVRRDPPEGKSLLFFSTGGLAKRAAEQLARLEGGRGGTELNADPNFPNVLPASLLDRLRQRWASPLKREQPRRRHDYTVEACVGLPNIWAVLHSNDTQPKSLISQWVVTNESPGGYAIMRLQGRAAGLSAGMAVALRRDSQDPWNLCVVRWIRSDAAEHVEIGLQMVSRGAIPVQVGFRGSEEGMACALVLPVLPALRQHQAVMAPAGTYVSRRFSLVSDIDRLYIAQCRLLTLDLQTSNVELFQFEIDPYPI